MPLDYKYLDGPVSLVELAGMEGMHLYIFGDWHIRKGCADTTLTDKENNIGISALLDKVFESNPTKWIDVFLESPFRRKESTEIKHGRRTYLEELRGKFEPCMINPKQECPFRNVRIHYTDFRIVSYGCLAAVSDVAKNIIDLRESKNPRIQDIDFGKAVEKGQGFDVTFDDMFINCKVEKQLMAIATRKIRWVIEDYFTNRLRYLWSQEIQPKYEAIVEAMTQIRRYGEKISHEGFFRRVGEELAENILEFGMHMHDYYLVTRVFRDFLDDSGERIYRSKYIIVYTGESHARNIVKCLTTIGFHIVQQETTIGPQGAQNPNQCIPLSGFRWPFFSPVYHETKFQWPKTREKKKRSKPEEKKSIYLR